MIFAQYLAFYVNKIKQYFTTNVSLVLLLEKSTGFYCNEKLEKLRSHSQLTVVCDGSLSLDPRAHLVVVFVDVLVQLV